MYGKTLMVFIYKLCETHSLFTYVIFQEFGFEQSI